MKVRRGERSNTFCGPAALSLITGKHVDKCVEQVHEYRDGLGKRRNVRGMSNWEMTWVLGRMGFQQSKLNVPKQNPTLVALMRWIKRQDFWDAKNVYLVNVTGHYVVMKGIKLFDNRNPEGVFFGRYEHRRWRVKHVWEVMRRDACPVPAASYR
jgi:hypothetical protein